MVTASRRLAPLPLLLIGLAVLLAALEFMPWNVQAQSPDSGSDFTLDAANGYPTGIWSDGTTMWVADFEDRKLYAYRMSDRSRDAGKDFTLNADNGSPVGIWSDGTTMWAADFADGKLYAYRMSDRRRDADRDFDTLFAAGNRFPEGIWSDGTTMWVADTGLDRLFAYDAATMARDADQDFTLDLGNDSPIGIWSNGYTMWVVDWRDAKLYAYSMSDRSRDAGKDFALDADDQSTEGIWSAGSTMWVASRDDGKLYAHDWNNPPTGAPTLTGAVRVDETLVAGTRSIADADGLDAAVFEYQWVSNDGNADTDIADATLSTYTLAAGDRGRTIRVRVSFTDAAGNEESLTSEPTGRVGAGGVCDRTPAVMAAIVAGMPGVGDCSEVSGTGLRTWAGAQRFGADDTPGLHLPGRGLSVLQAGDFGDLHALRALDLNRNFLEAVPDGLFQDLGMVEELHLSGNLLTELPDGTFDGQTANLSVLDLSGNRLELMPEGVLRNLAGLASLSLAGNGLARVPVGLFDDLGELEKLDLSANSIDQLPEGVFGGLDDLQRLSLAGNALESLPEDVFADLGSLGELDLSGNGLQDLPVGVFAGLSGLTELDAGDNPGAPFTFTAELERRGDDTVVVRLAEGATPFALKVELSARNGDLSAEAVTIAAGGSDSDVVKVSAHGLHPVTVEIDSAAFLLPAGGFASGVRADRGGAMLMWIGRPLVQREWIQDGPFALHPENSDPKSIWSDGETLWVGDDSAGKVFAYKLWDNPDTAESEYGTRDPGWDVPSLGEEDFYVTGHGPRLYVAEESLDGASRDVFGYDLTSFTRAEDRDFVYGGLKVAGGVFIVRGMATDGRHLWITNTTSRAHAFRLFDDPETPEDEYGKPDTARRLTIPGSGQLRGLFTDGRTMWGVRSASNDASARSVKLSDGTEAGYDFPLHEDNDHAYGIWSDGVTFYVVDADDNMIYTYHGVGGVVRPSVADAETAAALVGNTGQSGAAGHDLGSTGARRAQAFTTGHSNAGYALASLGIEFGEVSDASSAASDLEATLNADGGGVPGDALCTLIAPASLSERSVNTFAAPASGTTCPALEKATTYFLVVERVRVTGSGAIAVGGTASDAEDSGAAEGWSIEDGSQAYSAQADAPGWSSDAFPHQIEVRGSFINNPAAGEATVTGTAQVGRTLAAAVSNVSDDDGLTGATYSYRWLRVDGATETNIGTGSSFYELVAADLGKRIRVRVAFVDDRGNHETLASAATEAVEVFRAADQPGTVSLFPMRPKVGTVVSARLTDPDGLAGGGSGPAASLGAVSWSWARSADGTAWTGVEAYGEGDSYVPTEADDGMLLRAEASYTDGHGAGKSAQAVSYAGVGAREPGPELTVAEIVRGLSHPWGIDFTPDGTMLFTQRAGVLNARLTDGAVKRVAADLGDLLVDGFAGLQALAVDPDFSTNRRFYTLQGHTGREMQVIAWTIDADYDEATRVVDPLVKGMPIGPNPWHSGGRLVFGPQGHLWIATGDGRVVTGAQDLTSLGGKVLRVDPRTGAGAPGNPFGASSVVYSYGFRNPQGLALRPGSDQMWLVEHGPKHDDEINLLAAGGNYGWDPIPGDGASVFYDYADEAGVPMTDLAKFPSARHARWSSGFPTLATSGAVFLDGPQWGEWEGRLAVATLKTKSLRVFEFTEAGEFAGQIVVPELDGSQGRLRTPVLGPDGALYIATSNRPGNDRILRVSANRAATGAPFISGTPRVGEELAADTTRIADADGLESAVFRYQWIRLDGAIETNIGTDTSSYTLVAEDSGQRIRVRVTFTDDAENEEYVTSDATETVAPTAPGAPKSLKVSVRGTGTLEVSWEAPDSDGGSPVTGHRVQWKEAADSWTASEDVSEEAATGTVHTITGLRGGVEYSVRVMAVNDAGPGPASAEASATPQAELMWFATLTVGTAKDFAGYSSFAVGEENNTLGGLSSDTITVEGADRTVRVRVLGVLKGRLLLTLQPKLTAGFVLTVGNNRYSSGDATTREGYLSIFGYLWDPGALDWTEGDTITVGLTASETPSNTPATGGPTISGTAQVGETLTVDLSGITDDDGLDNAVFSYRWIRNDGTTDTDIPGATSSTHTLSDADAGKIIKVRVSFTDDAGHAETVTSTTTITVDQPGTVSLWPELPRIGTVVRATLTDPDGLEGAGPGAAASLGAVSWQWSRSSEGSTWTSVDVYQDGNSYAPTEDDEGMWLKVTAVYTDGHGRGKSAEAIAAATVGAREASPELTVTELVTGLTHPWDIAFTPDGTMLFTERDGGLRVRLTDGTVRQVTADLSDLNSYRTAGLLALVLDPDFVSNRRFYTYQRHTGPEMQVIAWTIDEEYTTATRVADPLVGGIPVNPNRGPSHGGGRLRFGPEGYLWIATGDGFSGTAAQDLTSLGGKVLRVDSQTGAGAPDNPFAPSPVYTYGHRNPQGLALRPGTGQMWSVEHGPDHDDEINLLVSGGNYGWDPAPDEGVEGIYDEITTPMTDLVKFPDALEAKWSSGYPTLAVGGGVFLEGSQWREWEGQFAVATLKTKSVRVFKFAEEGDLMSQVVVPELDRTYGRLRTAALGPDGSLYITTTNGGGKDKILKVAPTNTPATGAPSISGTAQVDQTLTADTSGVTDADGLDDVSYNYQWIAGDADIQHATGSTHTLTDDDAGQTIRVKVSFTDDAGNAESLTSQATTAVAARPNRRAAGAPSIRGVLQDQQVLTADTVGIIDADGLADATFSYQWMRVADGDAVDITGATVSTYTLTSTDVGDGIQLQVSFTDDRDNAESITSAVTQAVVASGATRDMIWLSTITFDSSAHEGTLSPSAFTAGDETQSVSYLGASFDSESTLALDLGSSPSTEQTSTWRLVLNDTELALADATATTTTSDPPAHRFQWEISGLAVVASDDDDNAPTVSIQRAFNLSATGAPTISGTPQVNETLTADTSLIDDGNGLNNVTFYYQWTVGGSNIDGATSSSYTLTSDEEGQTIQVQVSFTDDDGFSETATSVATAAVAAKPNTPATGAPTISGTAQVGETLTADTSGISDDDGLSNIIYSYQWIAGGTDIDGATGASFTLTISQQGETIQARVTFTDDADNSESLTSVATEAVAPKPIPLTASFSNVPDSHNGSGEFTFDLSFSENFPLSYKTLRDHAFTEDGGDVKRAQRKVPGSNRTWTITVEPDGNGAVSITLPETTDCDDDGAICTFDKRKLSHSTSVSVAGPE